MIAVNYESGLHISAIAAGLVLAVRYLTWRIRNSDDWKLQIIDLPALLLAVQLLIYIVVNTFVNAHEFGVINLIQAEFASGILPLRIASVLVATHVIAPTVDEIIGLHHFGIWGSLGNLSFAESRYFGIASIDWTVTFPVLRKIVSSQYSIYLVAIFTLWFCIHQSISNIWTVGLNFCIFFVVDDFGIIVKYLWILRGKIPNAHYYRLSILNAALAALSIHVAWTYLSSGLAALVMISMLVSSGWHYLLLVSAIQNLRAELAASESVRSSSTKV